MSKAKVGLAYDLGGRGDQSFNDSAARGLDKAKSEGVDVVGELEATANEPDSAKVDRLEQLASKGANVIIGVGFAYAGAIGEVAPEAPGHRVRHHRRRGQLRRLGPVGGSRACRSRTSPA